jgi:hypothetical protein
VAFAIGEQLRPKDLHIARGDDAHLDEFRTERVDPDIDDNVVTNVDGLTFFSGQD